MVVVVWLLLGRCMVVVRWCMLVVECLLVIVLLLCDCFVFFYVIVVCVFFLGGYLVDSFATAVVLLFYDFHVV